MAWTPSDRLLVTVWMAYKELCKLELNELNLCPPKTKGIPSNARDFLIEYNERAMNILRPPGKYVAPPTKLLDHLAKYRGINPKLLTEDPEILLDPIKIQAVLEKLNLFDEVDIQALAIKPSSFGEGFMALFSYFFFTR